MGNIGIRLDGERAQARTLCLNPVVVPLPDGARPVMFLAMWYRDRLVRTPHGWRMTERIQEGCIQHNVPAHLQVPASGTPVRSSQGELS